MDTNNSHKRSSSIILIILTIIIQTIQISTDNNCCSLSIPSSSGRASLVLLLLCSRRRMYRATRTQDMHLLINLMRHINIHCNRKSNSYNLSSRLSSNNNQFNINNSKHRLIRIQASNTSKCHRIFKLHLKYNRICHSTTKQLIRILHLRMTNSDLSNRRMIRIRIQFITIMDSFHCSTNSNSNDNNLIIRNNLCSNSIKLNRIN